MTLALLGVVCPEATGATVQCTVMGTNVHEEKGSLTKQAAMSIHKEGQSVKEKMLHGL